MLCVKNLLSFSYQELESVTLAYSLWHSLINFNRQSLGRVLRAQNQSDVSHTPKTCLLEINEMNEVERDIGMKFQNASFAVKFYTFHRSLTSDLDEIQACVLKHFQQNFFTLSTRESIICHLSSSHSCWWNFNFMTWFHRAHTARFISRIER